MGTKDQVDAILRDEERANSKVNEQKRKVDEAQTRLDEAKKTFDKETLVLHELEEDRDKIANRRRILERELMREKSK